MNLQINIDLCQQNILIKRSWNARARMHIVWVWCELIMKSWWVGAVLHCARGVCLCRSFELRKFNMAMNWDMIKTMSIFLFSWDGEIPLL